VRKLAYDKVRLLLAGARLAEGYAPDLHHCRVEAGAFRLASHLALFRRLNATGLSLPAPLLELAPEDRRREQQHPSQQVTHVLSPPSSVSLLDSTGSRAVFFRHMNPIFIATYSSGPPSPFTKSFSTLLIFRPKGSWSP
jgi:hypothetical protein